MRRLRQPVALQRHDIVIGGALDAHRLFD